MIKLLFLLTNNNAILCVLVKHYLLLCIKNYNNVKYCIYSCLSQSQNYINFRTKEVKKGHYVMVSKLQTRSIYLKKKRYLEGKHHSIEKIVYDEWHFRLRGNIN